jgi:hypothetical protein
MGYTENALGRRVSELVITTDGRDKGKRFVITEMPAVQAEKWAARAFFAVGGSGLDVPADFLTDAGPTTLERFAGLAAFVGQALLTCSFKDAEPLMDEMMSCVQIKPDPSNDKMIRAVRPEDYQEVRTILTVRREVLDLHLGFSTAAILSKFTQTLAARQFPDLQNIATSPSTSDA